MASAHRAAVLGSPIEHSLSPVLHAAGYQALGLDNWDYGRIECDAESLPQLVSDSDPSYAGFSVTMPGKFAALDFADEATDRANDIGSANTLVRRGDRWCADNTDCDGISGALSELRGINPHQLKECLVVGGGGTARPALWTLAELNVKKITVINRSDRSAELAPLARKHGAEFSLIGYEDDIEEAAISADVIISTVPSAVIAGLEAQLAHAPVVDVIYDPWPTPLVTQAAANGYPAVGGHIMLAHQSYRQFELFTGHPAPQQAMREALLKHIAKLSSS